MATKRADGADAKFLTELLNESRGGNCELQYGEDDFVELKFKAAVSQSLFNADITPAHARAVSRQHRRRAAIKVQFWGEELLDEWMAYAQRLVIEKWFELWSEDDRAALVAVFEKVESHTKKRAGDRPGNTISVAEALNCPFLRSIFMDVTGEPSEYAADSLLPYDVEADPAEAAEFEEYESVESKFNAATADFKFKSILRTTDREDVIEAAVNVQYWGELLLEEWTTMAGLAIERKMEELDDIHQKALIAVFKRVMSNMNAHTMAELEAAGYPFGEDCSRLEVILAFPTGEEVVEIDEDYLSHPDVKQKLLRHEKKRGIEDF